MVLRNLSLFLAVLATAGTALADSVPYPAELERAAIEVGLLSSILEHALIIG